jgi:hypothetical protein
MVYDVDLNSPLRYANDKGLKSGIMPEFKTMQGQVIAVFNSFACIIAAFFFGIFQFFYIRKFERLLLFLRYKLNDYTKIYIY